MVVFRMICIFVYNLIKAFSTPPPEPTLIQLFTHMRFPQHEPETKVINYKKTWFTKTFF